MITKNPLLLKDVYNVIFFFFSIANMAYSNEVLTNFDTYFNILIEA